MDGSIPTFYRRLPKPIGTSRRDALDKGLTYYFTGKPCKFGHISKRRKYGRCYECAKIYRKRTRKPKPATPSQLEAMRERRRYLMRTSKEYRAAVLAWDRKSANLPKPTRPTPEVCECCGRTQKKVLALDHCHKTGLFRGWLCNKCNGAIGMLGDCVDGVLLAVEYLKRNGASG